MNVERLGVSNKGLVSDMHSIGGGESTHVFGHFVSRLEELAGEYTQKIGFLLEL